MSGGAADRAALALAHRRLVVRRLPLFAACWLAVCVGWTVVLVLEPRLGLWGAAAVVGLHLGLLLAILSAARLIGDGRGVLAVVVAGCIALGLAAIVVFEAVRGDAEFLAYVLLTLNLASSLFFEWGWRPALVLLLTTVGVGLVVLPGLPVHMPTAETVGSVVTGAFLSIGVAEGYWRSFRDSWRHGVERDAVRARERATLAAAEAARATAEAATRAKDLFLAAVSHELRSPLAAALHWTDLMRRAVGTDPVATRALDGVDGSVRMSVRLIEDLLDVVRATHGKLGLERGLVDLREIVSAVADGLRFAAQEKRLALKVRLPEAAVSVHGDAGRLRQIVDNLLSNALKFTPTGGHVQVDLRRTECDAELTVRDSGIGIPASVLPHVFEVFRQGGGEAARRHGGLGLGLAIVRHLVEAHGGTIEASSEGAGRGATFRIRLPAVAEEQAGEGSALPSLGSLRVLLVDEDARAREFVAALLERCGAEVISVASAGEALDELGTHRPDVLVADVVLPRAGTAALIETVRAAERTGAPYVPAIAFTTAGAEARRRALDAGFDRCLPKPAHPVDVVLAVSDVTEATRRSTPGAV